MNNLKSWLPSSRTTANQVQRLLSASSLLLLGTAGCLGAAPVPGGPTGVPSAAVGDSFQYEWRPFFYGDWESTTITVEGAITGPAVGGHGEAVANPVAFAVSGWNPLDGDAFADSYPKTLAVNPHRVEVVHLNATRWDASTGQVHGQILFRDAMDALFVYYPLVAFWLPSIAVQSIEVFGLPAEIVHRGRTVDVVISAGGTSSLEWWLRFDFDGTSPMPRTIAYGVGQRGDARDLETIFRLTSYQRSNGATVRLDASGEPPSSLAGAEGNWTMRFPEGSPVTPQSLASASDAIEQTPEFARFTADHGAPRQLLCRFTNESTSSSWDITYLSTDYHQLRGFVSWDVLARAGVRPPDVQIEQATAMDADEIPPDAPSFPDRVLTLAQAAAVSSSFTTRRPIEALWIESHPYDFWRPAAAGASLALSSGARIGVQYEADSARPWDPLIVELDLVSPRAEALQYLL